MTCGRTPVLAIGSNQSPIRLGQKFGHDNRHRIPVQRATLVDFDVVFSAHVAKYGSIPAMLQVSAGSKVAVAITWLNDEQLAIMNATELGSGNYVLAELQNLQLTLDDGRQIDQMFAYIGQRGQFPGSNDQRGGPLALRAVECETRQFPDAHTHVALDLLKERHAPDMSSDIFVLRLVRDAAFRRQVIAAMEPDAEAFGYPYRVIEQRVASATTLGILGHPIARAAAIGAGHSLPTSMNPPGPYISSPCLMVLAWVCSDRAWRVAPPDVASI